MAPAPVSRELGRIAPELGSTRTGTGGLAPGSGQSGSGNLAPAKLRPKLRLRLAPVPGSGLWLPNLVTGQSGIAGRPAPYGCSVFWCGLVLSRDSRAPTA